MSIIIKWIVGGFILPALLFGEANAQTAASTQAFYTAMASANVSLWNKQLDVTKTLDGNDKAAFQGALLMRKSGTQKTAGQKLSMFKQGHKLLEKAIGNEPANIEYKFLRLMIQENAPKIVGYNKNIAEDARLLKSGYKSLPTVVQKAILSYSKTSKALKGLQ